MKGFHLWHRETKRAFYLKYKVGNKQKRPHIQDYAPPHYNLAGAREKAKKHLAAVELGQDPTAAKRTRIAAKTFRDLLEKKSGGALAEGETAGGALAEG